MQKLWSRSPPPLLSVSSSLGAPSRLFLFLPMLPRPCTLPPVKSFQRNQRNLSLLLPATGRRTLLGGRCDKASHTLGTALGTAWGIHNEGLGFSGAAWAHVRKDGGSFSAAAADEEADTVRKTGGDSERIEEDESEIEGRMHLAGGRSHARLPRERRNRGSSPSSSLNSEVALACAALVGLQTNADLLSIPGVGPRNLRKLVDKGIEGVADLKQLYKEKFFGESSPKMVEYLKSSVGIIHRNHAESITSFIKEAVDEELQEESSHPETKPAQKRLTFCVEGNISVGKTTFLQRIANETIELRDLVEVVPEPISKWQDIGRDHFNILDAFYAEPQRYAYTFQNYVFVTRVMQERESSGGIKPLRLLERSVFSDRMVFVRAVHEANWMNEMEISIYDSWFDPVVSCLPGLIPDGFIYLRATPDTCHKRMMLRKRAEEGGVSLDYLRDLHEKHESWLFPFQSGNHGVLSVNQLPFHMDTSLHPDIRDRVFYLEGDHMHSSIQKVPALVLDCEPNIDFSKDTEAKANYARQVAEFFDFVKKKKEMPSSKSDEDEKSASRQKIVLPHARELWTPDKNLFQSSALKPFDFRRTVSFLSN